jgi:predicted kinase
MIDRGKLIVFSGPACSGKSTLAAQLSVELAIPHLAMDQTRARLMPGSPHTRQDRAVAYRAMHWAAELLAGGGLDVILDAPYGHPEDRRELEQIAARAGAPLFLIECRVPPQVALARFRQRERGPRMDLTEERVDELVRAFRYCGRGLLLETGSLDVGGCLALIRQYLATGRPTPPGEWAGRS